MNALLKRLRKRADWLQSEYLAGGNFEHLSAREQECRYIIELLEQEDRRPDPLDEALNSGDGSYRP